MVWTGIVQGVTQEKELNRVEVSVQKMVWLRLHNTGIQYNATKEAEVVEECTALKMVCFQRLMNDPHIVLGDSNAYTESKESSRCMNVHAHKGVCTCVFAVLQGRQNKSGRPSSCWTINQQLKDMHMCKHALLRAFRSSKKGWGSHMCKNTNICKQVYKENQWNKC